MLTLYKKIVALSSLAGILSFTMIGCGSSSSPAPAESAAPAPPAPTPLAAYEGKMVRRPGPTPEDGKVYLVRNGIKQWVVYGSWFLANGYKLEDVKEIPAVDLERIPMGEPITTTK